MIILSVFWCKYQSKKKNLQLTTFLQARFSQNPLIDGLFKGLKSLK